MMPGVGDRSMLQSTWLRRRHRVSFGRQGPHLIARQVLLAQQGRHHAVPCRAVVSAEQRVGIVETGGYPLKDGRGRVGKTEVAVEPPRCLSQQVRPVVATTRV